MVFWRLVVVWIVTQRFLQVGHRNEIKLTHSSCFEFLFFPCIGCHLSDLDITFRLIHPQIYFEITGYPCNLISSQRCDLFTKCTFVAPNGIFSPANEDKTINQSNQSHEAITARSHDVDMFSKRLRCKLISGFAF